MNRVKKFSPWNSDIKMTSVTELFVLFTLGANLLLAILLLSFVVYLYRRLIVAERFFQHADPSSLGTCSTAGQYYFEIEDFLTPSECDQLIVAAHDKGLEQSQVGMHESSLDESIRKSKQTWFKPHEHPVANLIRVKVQDLVRTDHRVSECFRQINEYHYEDIQVVRYGVHGKYDPHHDSTECGDDVGLACGPNQRVGTVLIYLNDNFKGGYTRFPKLDYSVKPKRGKAVFFWVSDATGNTQYTYDETLHGGDPVLQGEKYIATQWIRFGSQQA